MRQKIMLLILMTMGLALHLRAQNSIDALVENYSATGSSTFTSAVERDPQTREVVKVAKVLEISGSTVNRLVQAFEKERETGNFSRKEEDYSLTMILTVETPEGSRVYMLQCDGSRAYRHHGKVTIVVNRRKP